MKNKTKTLLARFLAEKLATVYTAEYYYDLLGEFEVKLRNSESKRKEKKK